MSISLANRIKSIASIARIFLEKHKILKSISSVDYVAIFPKSKGEYDVLDRNLVNNGTLLRATSTGKIFKLDVGISTELGTVYIARLRIYDSKMTQVGYVDCQTHNYSDFRNSLAGNVGCTITHNSDGMEMVMLTEKDVIIYFPSRPYELKS